VAVIVNQKIDYHKPIHEKIYCFIGHHTYVTIKPSVVALVGSDNVMKGRSYQQWQNLSVRTMVVVIKPRLATNIIFTTVVVSLLACLENVGLRDSGLCRFISANKI